MARCAPLLWLHAPLPKPDPNKACAETRHGPASGALGDGAVAAFESPVRDEPRPISTKATCLPRLRPPEEESGGGAQSTCQDTLGGEHPRPEEDEGLPRSLPLSETQNSQGESVSINLGRPLESSHRFTATK